MTGRMGMLCPMESMMTTVAEDLRGGGELLCKTVSLLKAMQLDACMK